MVQYNNKNYLEAMKEMKEFKETTDPLAALLLINHYTHSELKDIVENLPLDVINDIEIRFQIANQLIKNCEHKDELENRQDSFPKQESESGKYCDFKEVMRILNRSKGKVDSLINKGKITAFRDEDIQRGKRTFIRADIYKYLEGIKD